jgi:hypothetical protein
MSGHGFHVHGPHDHELEHAAQGAHIGADSFAGKIAVVTAIIASIGALFGYMGTLTQADAGIFKNTAAIKKTEASDQWAYYQSKSAKQNMAELAVAIVPDERRPQYQKEADRYKAEKEPIRVAAEKLEGESKEWDERSELQLHLHHRWAQATTAMQISIALAAMALLTRRRWLEGAMYTVASVGVVLGVLAAMHV